MATADDKHLIDKIRGELDDPDEVGGMSDSPEQKRNGRRYAAMNIHDGMALCVDRYTPRRPEAPEAPELALYESSMLDSMDTDTVTRIYELRWLQPDTVMLIYHRLGDDIKDVISYQVVPEDVLEYEWGEIMLHARRTAVTHQPMSERFLRAHASDFGLLAARGLPAWRASDMWPLISATQELSESFMEDYKDKLDWKELCFHQRMSERFIEEVAAPYLSPAEWRIVHLAQNLTYDFRIRHNGHDILDLDPYEGTHSEITIRASCIGRISAQKRDLWLDLYSNADACGMIGE